MTNLPRGVVEPHERMLIMVLHNGEVKMSGTDALRTSWVAALLRTAADEYEKSPPMPPFDRSNVPPLPDNVYDITAADLAIVVSHLSPDENAYRTLVLGTQRQEKEWVIGELRGIADSLDQRGSAL